MIVLTTGQPGAGKTLFTLWQVQALAQKENRQVYYSGIPELVIPGWIELDKAEDWHKCPPGAIIVIDEGQRVFRPRGNGTAVPEHVAKFETHRHNGHDVFVITQHPMLIDSNIRRLVGRHCHVMRAFGSNAANIHEWTEVKEQVDKNRGGSIQTLWKYPKEVFTWYKSAEVHTHKLRLPGRLFFLVLAPFIIGALVWGIYKWWQPRISGEHSKEVISKVTGQPVGAAGTPVKDKAAYLEERVPRIAGLAHTAPIYDSVTTPTEAPIPAGCIKTAKYCRCIDQQGVDYPTDDATCGHIVQHGFFVAWRKPAPEKRQQDDDKRHGPAQSAPDKPSSFKVASSEVER
jgi:hypothetical protein